MVNNHLKNFSTKIPVVVMESVTSLGYRDTAGNPITSVKGTPHGGKVYLFADSLVSRKDAIDTLFHKLFHLGLRRFMARDQYISTLNEIYSQDTRIRQMAETWIGTEDGEELRDEGESESYIRARGTDEALAHFAAQVDLLPTGYKPNSISEKLARVYMRLMAKIADLIGDHERAAMYCGVTGDDARKLIKERFRRLRGGGREPEWDGARRAGLPS